MSMRSTAAVAAVSAKRGLIFLKIFPKSVDRFKFIKFCKLLSKKLERQPFTMFLDNLGAHHAHETKAACQKLKINMIFNAAYQHDMNPIEMVFNVAKLRFKQAKLHAITNKLPFDNDALIIKAFN